MTGHTKEPCTLGVGCDEFGVCYAASSKQPWRCPHTTDREAKGWLWLDEMVGAMCDEHAADLTYSADQMVDAFMAGMDNAPRLATIPDPQAFMEAARGMRERAGALLANLLAGGIGSANQIETLAVAVAAFDAAQGEQ